MVIKLVVGFVVSDVPEEVEIQVARNEYLVRKCLYRERDDDDDIDEDAEGIVSHSRGSKYSPSQSHTQQVIFDTDPEIETILTKIATSLTKALKGQPPESIFEKVNTNKSKGISRKEFSNMLTNILQLDGVVRWDDIRRLVTALDKNSNGYVDPDEFLALLRRAKT